MVSLSGGHFGRRFHVCFNGEESSVDDVLCDEGEVRIVAAGRLAYLMLE